MKTTAPIISDVLWLAVTAYMEAAGEPYEGKLAVAYTIVNRATEGHRSISDTVFKRFQFSALNTKSVTRMNIDEIKQDSRVWIDCYKAACSAYYRLENDPSFGATSYLNIELTKKIRGGTLPSWFYKMNIVTIIGKHTFLKKRKNDG